MRRGLVKSVLIVVPSAVVAVALEGSLCLSGIRSISAVSIGASQVSGANRWTPLSLETRSATKLYAIAFSPNSQFMVAAGGGENKVTVWERTDNKMKLRANLGVSDAACTSVAFSPDSQHFAVASLSGVVRVYSLSGEGAVMPFGKPFRVGTVKLTAIAWHPKRADLLVVARLDGNLEAIKFDPEKASSNDSVLSRWDKPILFANGISELKPASMTKDYFSRITGVSFSPEGDYLLTFGRRAPATNVIGGRVALWTVESRADNTPRITYQARQGKDEAIDAAAFVAPGDDSSARLVYATVRGDVFLWNPSQSAERKLAALPGKAAGRMVVFRESSVYIAASTGLFRVPIQEKSVAERIGVVNGDVYVVGISPDGSTSAIGLFTGGDDLKCFSVGPGAAEKIPINPSVDSEKPKDSSVSPKRATAKRTVKGAV